MMSWMMLTCSEVHPPDPRAILRGLLVSTELPAPMEGPRGGSDEHRRWDGSRQLGDLAGPSMAPC